MPVVDDFCVPFAAHIHPNAAAVHPHHLRWLTDNELLPERAVPQYEGWKLTEYAARTYPWASDTDLKTACDLYGWWGLFDDCFDAAQGLNLQQTRARTATIAEVMRGGGELAYPDDVFARSFTQVWAVLTDGMSAYWIDRHRRHWQKYLDGYAWENTTRDSGRIPELAEYLDQRRWNIVMDPCYDLIERFNRAELPAEAAEDTRFDALHMLATRVVLIVNDTFSVEKETETGDADYNLLTLLSHHELLSFDRPSRAPNGSSPTPSSSTSTSKRTICRPGGTRACPPHRCTPSRPSRPVCVSGCAATSTGTWPPTSTDPPCHEP
ncbi:terpene synthase family protein [Nocardia thraciensis]